MEQAQNNNILEQKSLIDLNFKREMRRKALEIADRVSPLEYSQAMGIQQQTKPSIASILANAEIIYNWFIKEL